MYTDPVRGFRLCGLLLLASCFDASIPDGMLRCEADRDRPCPAGMVCLNGACYAGGTLLDLGPAPEAGLDGSPDGPSLGPLTCGAPVVVGSTSTPAKGLYEVALRADGKTLVAVAPDTGLYWAITRPAVGQAFGAWTQTAATFLAEKRDPTFFSMAGQELALVAGGDVPQRHLELCTVPFDAGDCTSISVIDTKDGNPIALDMDGPSVAALPGGGLLMAHNVAHAGAPEPHMTGDLFLAKPVDAASPAGNWLSTAVPGMVSQTEVESDPALGPDGLVLVYSLETSSGDEDLMVAERQDTKSAFSAPRPLEALNTEHNETTPDLGALPAGGLELFFSSDRDGVRQVYRAECSR